MEQATVNLRRRVRHSARRLGLPALWRWWTGELAAMLPRSVRTAARRRRVRPALVFGTDAVVLRVPRNENGALVYAEAARVPLGGDAAAVTNAGRAAVDTLARMVYGGAVAPAKVAIVLPREQVLRKTLTLPALVEDNLRSTLAFDLDRHTPFKPDEVYFDAVVTGRDPARKEITIAWAAALKATVEQTRRRAEAWGATVVEVWPDLPDPASPVVAARLNLLPPEERPDASTWRRWTVVAPVALLLLLVLVAIGLPLWQKREQAMALMQLADQARVQANASDALRTQLDQLVGDYNFALQRKYSFPSAVQVVEDVTRTLPDDTWLTQLEMRTPAKGKDAARRDILLRGESANAGRLVSLLEETKLFEQAAPRSPTTKIQPGPGEIFDLGAQLTALAPPATVQLASLPPVPPRREAATATANAAAAPGASSATPLPAEAARAPAASPPTSAPQGAMAPSAATQPRGIAGSPDATRDPRAPGVAGTAPPNAAAPIPATPSASVGADMGAGPPEQAADEPADGPPPPPAVAPAPVVAPTAPAATSAPAASESPRARRSPRARAGQGSAP